MIDVNINGRTRVCLHTDDFVPLLAEIAALPKAEVWLCAPGGEQLCLLQAGDDAMLVYLRDAAGDPGFVSLGDDSRRGSFTVTLANGQRDEYPRAQCIERAEAHRALAHFVATSGERAPFVRWRDEGIR